MVLSLVSILVHDESCPVNLPSLLCCCWTTVRLSRSKSFLDLLGTCTMKEQWVDKSSINYSSCPIGFHHFGHHQFHPLSQTICVHLQPMFSIVVDLIHSHRQSSSTMYQGMLIFPSSDGHQKWILLVLVYLFFVWVHLSLCHSDSLKLHWNLLDIYPIRSGLW